MNKNIALLTDFGLTDNYAGILKGVILKINPEANIIDISHNIQPQNILQASWVLETSYRYFPDHTVFLSIVDPGVGTKRRKLLIKTDKYYFIAPDNGLLTGIIDKENIEQIINIENPKFFLNKISQTFHGRDIFAAFCAHLSLGHYGLFEFGAEIDINSVKKLKVLAAVKDKNIISGTVMNIDHFGNVITNIPDNYIKNAEKFELITNNNIFKVKVCDNYTEVPEGELLGIISSANTLEFSINCSNAQKHLNMNIGDQIKIEIQ